MIPAGFRETHGPYLGSLVAAALAITLLSVTLYAPAYHFAFLDYDDPGYVTENRAVRDGLSWGGARWAFASTQEANWHPVTWLSHQLDVELFGLDPRGHHLDNILLHAANALALLALLHALTGRVWTSALVAALFGVHPLHVESVAWVSERKDLLSTFFALLAALVYVRAARRARPARSLAAPALFAAALLSKPMPLTLPFLLLLLDWWPLGRWSPLGDGPRPAGRNILGLLPPARLWIEKVPFFLLAAASAVITYRVQSAAGAVHTAAAMTLPTRLANAAVSTVAYLMQAIFPRGLSIFYPHTYAMPEFQRWAACALALAVLCLLALRQTRRLPFLGVGGLWFLGMLVPVSGLVQVGSAARADRYTYLSLTGIFIACVWGGRELARRAPRLRRPLTILAFASLLLYAAAAASYLRYWRDDEAVFRRALSVTTRNPLAHGHLALAAMKREDWPEAEEQLRAAIALEPGNPSRHANLGVVLASMDRSGEAIAALRASVALDPANAATRERLGLELVKAGSIGEGIDQLRSAAERAPASFTARYNLGKALAQAGRLAESTAAYEAALRIKPDDSNALNNSGQNLALQGRLAEAAERFTQALALDPGNRAARENLARSRQALDDRAAGLPR